MSKLAKRLIDDFSNKDYAHGYMEDHVNAVIAAQIKALREQRGLTQAQLAALAHMKQERVCALENVDYDAWTAKTLRKLAKAFDTHLQVCFVPFSQGILGVANLSLERLRVSTRKDDLKEFSQQLLVNPDGEWRSIDARRLTPTIAKVVRGPFEPNEKWQELEGTGV